MSKRSKKARAAARAASREAQRAAQGAQRKVKQHHQQSKKKVKYEPTIEEKLRRSSVTVSMDYLGRKTEINVPRSGATVSDVMYAASCLRPSVHDEENLVVTRRVGNREVAAKPDERVFGWENYIVRVRQIVQANSD